jgi:uncharacterized peroxidase-related enzyme
MTILAKLETLKPLDPDNAPDGSREILQASIAQSGRIPNMYALMANSAGLMQTYRLGYEAFRADSGFNKTEQEVVFLTISRFHECKYCVSVHSAIADRNRVESAVTDAIRDGLPISESKLEALRSFTESMLATRGRPSSEDLSKFLSEGFTELQVLEIILAIAVKTISNYSNHLFDTELDQAFEKRAWHPLSS